MIRKTAIEFARKELEKNREALDNHPSDSLLKRVLGKIYDMDLFHFTIPESHGGTGEGITSLCAVLEAISSEDAGVAGILFSHHFSIQLLIHADAGTVLSGLCKTGKTAGQIMVASPCYTNPSEIDYVADVLPAKDGYRLSGTIPYVVPAVLASKAVIPGRIKGQDDYSWFLIEIDQPGVAHGMPVQSLGLHVCQALDLTLTRAVGQIVGNAGHGAEIFDHAADAMHLAAAAMATGVMKGSFAEATEYAGKRDQGGRKIINWTELRMILANMAVQTEIANMLLEKGCEHAESQANGWRQSSRAAAIHILSSACDLTTDGVQISLVSTFRPMPG